MSRVISPSRFKDLMTGGQSKTELFGLTAKAYAKQIAAEMAGVRFPEISTPEMRHGLTYEFEAIQAYEQATGHTIIVPEDRITAQEFAFVSGLPDGLVGADGIIEVKCPNLRNHLDNLMEGAQIAQYMYQMQGYLWLTGRKWCDFVSYHPAEAYGFNGEVIATCPEHLQLSIQRVERDEEIIASIIARIEPFWGLVYEYSLKLKYNGLLTH
jgi:hypothetical protein